MTENRCRFCYEEHPVPSLVRFCEERHLKAIQSIQGVSWRGLGEVKNFIGGELTTRIEKAVLGTFHDTRHSSGQNKDGSNKGVVGRVWWENPNLQDIPVLISLGIPPQLLEQIEIVESHKKRPGLRLQGLSSEPEKVIAKLLM